MREDLLISGSWTNMVLRSFETLGLDARRLCSLAGLSYAQLSDPEARVPRDFSGRLWREAARQSGDPLVGLHAGERVPPSANNLLTHMVISSPTFLDGLERTLPYQRVLAHGRVARLERRGDVYALVFQRVDGDLPITRSEIEFMTAALARLGRFAVRRRWRLAEVRFDFPVTSASDEYERFFGCRVEFAQRENSVLVPEDVMRAPLTHHCPAVLEALEQAVTAALERVQHPTFAGEVRARILGRMRMRRGDCSVDAVAAELHVSPRTLQRRLEAEHASFSGVLEEAQRDRCVELLDGDATLDEIGAAVGLSGSRALARAFKRWTGRTPSEHRRLARGAEAGGAG